jgi:hypothetical protein
MSHRSHYGRHANIREVNSIIMELADDGDLYQRIQKVSSV